jgi:hypothetical protein
MQSPADRSVAVSTEKGEMAVGVMITVRGGSQQQYDRIAAAVFPGGELPDGWAIHIAGPTESGWRVINVVPSQEEFETFAREKLIPAAQQVDDQPAEIAFFPIHRVIHASPTKEPACPVR